MNASYQGRADEHWMRLALGEALEAAEHQEVPVGAVAVYQGELLTSSHNRSLELCDPTAHAEILLLREAGRLLQNYRLSDLEVFVSLEPCAMCAGALIWARISRLVYAAADPKAGAVESRTRLLEAKRFNHTIQVVSGVCAEESARILQDFFRVRRS